MSELGDRLRGVLSRAAQRQERATQGPQRTTRADLVSWAQRNLRDRRLIVVSNREPYSHTAATAARSAGSATPAASRSRSTRSRRRSAACGSRTAAATPTARPPTSSDRVRCPPDAPALHAAPRVADARGPRPLLLRVLERRAVAAVPHRLRAAALPPRRMGALSRRQPPLRRGRARGDRRPAGVRVPAGLPPGARGARPSRRSGPTLWSRCSGTSRGPTPRCSASSRGGRSCSRACSPTTWSASTSAYHALNFLDSVADALEARVDRERLRGRARRPAHLGAPLPDRRERERDRGAGRVPRTARASEREMRARARPRGLQRRPRRRPARLHQGHPRAARGARAPVREASRVDRASCASSRSAVPSRIELDEYRAVLRPHPRAASSASTRASRAPGGPTVHLIEDNLDFRELVPYYRLADLCAVTSLHDGMNLVAKEYLAATPDSDGALVLSPFTGAARELERAWLASPYDREGAGRRLPRGAVRAARGAARAHGARCARPCCGTTSSTGRSRCSTPSSVSRCGHRRRPSRRTWRRS